MATNFKFNNGGTITDFSDAFIPRDLFSNGGLWGWGKNTNGRLGDNSIVNKSSPVQTIAGGTNWKQICLGTTSSGIKTDGTLWTWGHNYYGALGQNLTGFGGANQRSSPVQTIASGTNWKRVSSSDNNCAAIKTDGTLWIWGYNYSGQLGDNTVVNKSSPVQTVAAGTNWKQVCVSPSSTAAIKTDGTLWMWGDNGVGQLGDNTIVKKSSPVQTIAGGTNWKAVSLNGLNCIAGGIKTDGTLWMWGFNNGGQLGDNTIIKKSSPVQTIAGGANWKQVDVGDDSVGAIKTDGTLWLWGSNGWSQLTTGSNRSSPIQIPGTIWKQVSMGTYNTSAIKTDGTLWMWGANDLGQGGIGAVTPNSLNSPVQTVAGGTNWKQVSSKSQAALAIKDDF